MNIARFFQQDKKLLIKVVAGILLFVAAFSFYLIKESAQADDLTLSVMPENVDENLQAPTEAALETAKPVIMIDVAGAVVNPSVVELPEGSRVFQAVDMAGGLTAEADTSATNQAEILIDGQKIYIPTIEELKGNPAAASLPHSLIQSAGLININTADSETLQQLSGIGPVTAKKIIDYRNANGRFKTIADIKNVSGIGDKTFEKFKDKITV